MAQDKYSAVWLSHSSINDYLKCPRAYFLHNIYKDPVTKHKVSLINPSLALGQVVHAVLESMALLPIQTRLSIPLLTLYKEKWKAVTGKAGGFKSSNEEDYYKTRGVKMLQRVTDNPGPLLNKALRIKKDLPSYYLSETENIILCGKIDWLEYIESDDSVHVIDFKTGKHDEEDSSLQLPIYHLLVKNCQSRNVSKASYWYLDREDTPLEVELPDTDQSTETILTMAKTIKSAREQHTLSCPKNGCFACKPYEAIVHGGAEFVGVGGYNQDLYILK